MHFLRCMCGDSSSVSASTLERQRPWSWTGTLNLSQNHERNPCIHVSWSSQQPVHGCPAVVYPSMKRPQELLSDRRRLARPGGTIVPTPGTERRFTNRHPAPIDGTIVPPRGKERRIHQSSFCTPRWYNCTTSGEGTTIHQLNDACERDAEANQLVAQLSKLPFPLAFLVPFQ